MQLANLTRLMHKVRPIGSAGAFATWLGSTKEGWYVQPVGECRSTAHLVVAMRAGARIELSSIDGSLLSCSTSTEEDQLPGGSPDFSRRGL